MFNWKKKTPGRVQDKRQSEVARWVTFELENKSKRLWGRPRSESMNAKTSLRPLSLISPNFFCFRKWSDQVSCTGRIIKFLKKKKNSLHRKKNPSTWWRQWIESTLWAKENRQVRGRYLIFFWPEENSNRNLFLPRWARCRTEIDLVFIFSSSTSVSMCSRIQRGSLLTMVARLCVGPMNGPKGRFFLALLLLLFAQIYL